MSDIDYSVITSDVIKSLTVSLFMSNFAKGNNSKNAKGNNRKNKITFF